MTEMRDNNSTIAFIGPDGHCAAEALVAAAWNVPMITHVIINYNSRIGRIMPNLKCDQFLHESFLGKGP